MALDLEPGDYDGTYKLIAGRPSLDFVNTVSWPNSDRRHDWLSSPENLDRWCDANDLASTPPATADDVELARELRSELGEVLRPLAFDERPTAEAIERLNKRLTDTRGLRRVDPKTLAFAWTAPLNITERLAPIVLDAADILTGSPHDRLRHCDACDWLFDDQSRSGRRRWCDMRDCGSRAKSRSYYQRTKGTSA